MVLIEEILPNGATVPVEAYALEEAEVALIVANPELAPAVGLGWLASYLWKHYGDHIQSYIKKQTLKGINELKDKVSRTVSSREHRDKRQKTIDFKKTKPNRRRRSPVNAERDVEEKQNQAENPAPPDSQAAIPQMGKWTSYPNTAMCVDLGTMNLDPKGGRYGDKVYDDDIVGQWTTSRQTYTYQARTTHDQRLFQFLTDAQLDMTSTLEGNEVTQLGTDGLNQRHQIRTKFTKTSNYRNCSFNSVIKLNEILENMPRSAETTLTFAHPVPEGSTYEDRFAQTNDANMLVCLKNQFIELHIKNMTKTALSSSTTVGAFTDGSPLKCTLRILEAKQDVLAPVTAATGGGTQSNIFNETMNEGFSRSWDRSASSFYYSSAASTLSSSEQNYMVYYGDNQYLEEYWKIVDKKDFCLCPGQEGTVRIGLPKKQILSYNYLLNALKGTVVSGTFGVDAVWRMKTPFIKKGEQHVFIEMHGGIAGAYNTTETENASVNVQPIQAFFYWTHSYDYAVLSTARKEKAIRGLFGKTTYTKYDQDPDVEGNVE